MRGVFLILIGIGSSLYGKGDYDVDFLKKLQKELAKRGNPWIAGPPTVSQEFIERVKELGHSGVILPLKKGKAKESQRARERRLKKVKPPAEFDWRNYNGYNWMTPVKAQGDCGSCSYFATMGVLEARIKILSNTPNAEPNLSEQFVISCRPSIGGCCGAWVWDIADFIKIYGVPDEDCFPYKDGATMTCSQATAHSCDERCSDWKSRIVIKVEDYGRVPDSPEAYKNEVMNGPCYCVIEAKEDLFYYKSGVYTPIMGKPWNHAVCLCGWNDSEEYWIIKNSWGSSYPYIYFKYGGEGGHRGPSYVFWVTPKFPISIDLEDYRLVEINNNIWDPGESVNIIVTLKAKRANFANVSAVLSTADSDVKITTSNATFGSISEGSSASNSENPFVASAIASATEHEVLFTLQVTADTGGPYSGKFSFTLPIGVKRFDYVDIVAGNAILTVTDIASIGYDSPRENGKGFIYGGINTLYFGSMAFGNSEAYVVDNWYIKGIEDKDWQPTTIPIGRLKWVTPPLQGDTMALGYYSDTGDSITSQNVVCEQYAWGFNDPNYDDFVIMQFKYINNGSSPITGLYSAIFADFDIGRGSNNAGINESKYLAWVSGETVYAGITLLAPLSIVKNMSTIKNEDYIHPNNGMTDADQYLFMNGTLNFGNQSNADYSVVVSAGPFDLSPGENQVVAFAIVGGNSQSEIETHSDKAREIYSEVAVEEKDKILPNQLSLSVTPNPIFNIGVISFSLPHSSNVTVDVYDITGRCFQRLTQKEYEMGIHVLKWDTSKVPAGIFFVKLNVGDRTIVKKVLVF